MEFNEKLQELRKAESLTQQELADAIFVSRTAVSKWESGRGYPNIDSLKELSRFFHVSIDELIGADEVVIAAESEKRAFVDKYSLLICGVLDIFLVLLLLIPAFGNGADVPSTASLLTLNSSNPWLKAMFAIFVGTTILCGLCEIIASHLDRPTWGKALLATGVALLAICVAMFIISRQPYAGIICFALLIAKALLLFRQP